MVFGRHVTKQRSDWPELFGMARTKESAQRYQTTFSAAILLAEVVGRERDYVFIWLHVTDIYIYIYIYIYIIRQPTVVRQCLHLY